METTPKSRPWFVLFPIALLLVMMTVPSMRGLIESQWKLVFHPPHGVTWALRAQGVNSNDLPDCDPGEEQAALQSLASTHPQDYQIQLADSLMAEWSHADNTPDERVKRLDQLAGVFPARATVYAHILRYETEREVKVRRQVEFEHFVNQTPLDEIKIDPDEAHPPADLKKRLDEFERYAVAGENLEPDNAYFSMMRAIGLFASHDDRLAVSCIESAAAKHQWEDHVSDELEADWRLGSLAFGNDSAALRSVIQGGVGSPHLDQLAAVGRTAAALSIDLELTGKGDEGLALRMAMAHCGAIMRSSAHTIAAAITGADIVYQQIYRPGGAPLIVEDVNFSKSEREQQRLDAYFSYLKKYKHSDEAAWMQGELKKDALVREIQKEAARTSLSPYGHAGLRLTSWWMLDCVLLMNVCWLLLPIIILLPFIMRKKVQASSIVLVTIGTYLFEFAATSMSQWGLAMMALRGFFRRWIERNGGVGPGSHLYSTTDRIFDVGSLHIVVLILAMASTVAMFLLLYSISRKTNIVFIDTIKLEIVQVGSLIACAVLLMYAAALMKTAQHENQMRIELDQVMTNEGKYDAPLVGKEWPD